MISVFIRGIRTKGNRINSNLMVLVNDDGRRAMVCLLVCCRFGNLQIETLSIREEGEECKVQRSGDQLVANGCPIGRALFRRR